MQLLLRALAALPRDRSGRITVEQGLIAALIGVMVVSIVTTLTGTLDVPAPAVTVPEVAAPEMAAVVGQRSQ